MNSKIKTGLIFGIAMTVFFIAENLLTNDHLTTKEIFKAIALGLFAGSISGLLFGWFLGKFSSSKFVRDATKIDISADELIFETPANHFKGIEAVGGKLVLTDKRLIFKSHRLNIQNHQLTINLSDVTQVDKYKTLGLVNNGLSIQITRQTTEKFVVEKIDEWLSHLNGTKNGLQQKYLQ
jgi:hypothetical protein